MSGDKTTAEILRFLVLRESEWGDSFHESEQFHKTQKNCLCDHIERQDNYIASLEAQIVKAKLTVDNKDSAGPIELKYFR